MFADIVVAVKTNPYRNTFTYETGDLLVEVGDEVTVPFGEKKAKGYVVAISETPPYFPKGAKVQIKPIISLGKPLLLPEQIELARKMARYYLAPFADCISLMIAAAKNLKGTDLSAIETLVAYPYTSWSAEFAAAHANPNTYIGSRSSILLPLPNLKKVILYHEEKSSYKEERSPYYHTLKVAELSSEIKPLEIEVRSFAPRIETFYQVSLGGKITLKLLERRAVRWEFLDQSPDLARGDFTLLSRNLLKVLDKIAPRKRILFFGIAGKTKQFALKYLSARGLTLENARFSNQEILATLEKFDAIFFLDPDLLFTIPDPYGEEKIFGMIASLKEHVSPRGTFYLQTQNPQNPLFKIALEGDYQTLYAQVISDRELFDLPPFSKLAKITLGAKKEKTVLENAAKIAASLSPIQEIEVFPPSKQFLKKVRDEFRIEVILKTKAELGSAKAELSSDKKDLPKVGLPALSRAEGSNPFPLRILEALPKEAKIEVDPDEL